MRQRSRDSERKKRDKGRKDRGAEGAFRSSMGTIPILESSLPLKPHILTPTLRPKFQGAVLTKSFQSRAALTSLPHLQAKLARLFMSQGKGSRELFV